MKSLCVVFDLDGTIADLAVDWTALRHELEGIACHAIDSFDTMLLNAAEPTKAQLLKALTSAEQAGADNAQLRAGANEILNLLADRFAVAVMTRNSRLAARAVLEKCTDSSKFFIVGREDVTMLKPHPEGLELIGRHYGCTASQIIVVGDTFHDIEAAHAFGSKVAIINNEKVTNKPIGADWYLGTLSELTTVLDGLTNEGERYDKRRSR